MTDLVSGSPTVSPNNSEHLKSLLAQYNDHIVLHTAEAKELGMKWDDIDRGINMVDDSVRLQAVKQSFQGQASMMGIFWRNMSGHAHAIVTPSARARRSNGPQSSLVVKQ